MNTNDILNRIAQIEHGFQHIVEAADEILQTHPNRQCYEIAFELFKHETYQARMLSTTILGRLATKDDNALCFLREQVSTDKNWRVQEMLAKAFDEVCRYRGYEASLPIIKEWLDSNNPNVIRAVTEGLRIWTNRPFFKENPLIAIALISKHKAHESEYLRKSVGNALRDISKKHAALIQNELQEWDLTNPQVLFTYKLATKFLNKR